MSNLRRIGPPTSQNVSDTEIFFTERMSLVPSDIPMLNRECTSSHANMLLILDHKLGASAHPHTDTAIRSRIAHLTIPSRPPLALCRSQHLVALLCTPCPMMRAAVGRRQHELHFHCDSLRPCPMCSVSTSRQEMVRQTRDI